MANKIAIKTERYALLFSGGKDSTYAGYLAKKKGYEISCLISIVSENPESYMFHTPSISKVEKQAEVMQIPIIIGKTKGEKEKELEDLEDAIKFAIKKYKIEGIVTGAVASVYQLSRVQKICDKLKIEVFNPLWQKNQIQLLNELIENKFEVIIVGIGAEGFDESWLGRKLDKNMIEELKKMNEKYKINPAFEGGEAETFVLSCPLFKKKLKIIKSKKIMDKKYSGYLDIQKVKIC